ncbi:MAG: hypothetical protein IJU63_03700, partial [Bacteroidales bacterium]|nr:hypothetical protein [Bacteroidales bacterium]
MKRILTTAFVLILAASAVSGQELANFSRQSTTSPEIANDSVTFRLSADYATVVTLQTNWLSGRTPMQKKGGVWSVTLPLPEPEIYTYNFVVDGVAVNDAANFMVQRDGTRYLNMLFVPGERSANYYEA